MLDENNLSLLRTYIGDAYVTRSRERLAGVRRKFERVLEEVSLRSFSFLSFTPFINKIKGTSLLNGGY